MKLLLVSSLIFSTAIALPDVVHLDNKPLEVVTTPSKAKIKGLHYTVYSGNLDNAEVKGEVFALYTDKDKKIGKLINTYGYAFNLPELSHNASALQLAIWDVYYDDGDGLDKGRFRSTNALASSMVNSLKGLVYTSGFKLVDVNNTKYLVLD